MRSSLLVLFCAVFSSHAFIQNKYCRQSTSNSIPKPSACFSSKFPTLEELSSDPFMKQVSHASEIVTLLGKVETGNKQLEEMISAQLSHSDGIRGFFVSYLTGEEPSPADDDDIPKPLVSAIQENKNKKELISLACMNVIMPTAMITMHTDEEMSKSSAKTAARGEIIARALVAEDEMRNQCSALLAVAQNEAAESDGINEKVSDR